MPAKERGYPTEMVIRCLGMLLLACLGACATPQVSKSAWTLISGTFEANKGPDGNTVLLEGPKGLIVVDTGRHPAHQERILAAIQASGRPLRAVVNTHWHLDHSGGNAEFMKRFPGVPLFGTLAVEGALTGFFPGSRKDAERFLASGQASEALAAEIRRDFAAVDAPEYLRPTVPIASGRRLTIAGRELEFQIAPFAATEADLWIRDPAEELVVVGDLVVAMVPFFDTGCPEGWRRALDAIAASRFETLVPGHGEAMSRSQFLAWRSAFNGLLDCAASAATTDACADGWLADAAAFIPRADERRVRGMVAYYLTSRLKAPPAERDRFCRPLR